MVSYSLTASQFTQTQRYGKTLRLSKLVPHLKGSKLNPERLKVHHGKARSQRQASVEDSYYTMVFFLSKTWSFLKFYHFVSVTIRKNVLNICMLNTDKKVGMPRLEWSERKYYNPHMRVSSVDLLCLKQLQIMSLMPYSLERRMFLPKLSNLQLQPKVKMQTLPLKNSVSIHRGICLSVVIFQANIYYKNQYMIKITRAVCLSHCVVQNKCSG